MTTNESYGFCSNCMSVIFCIFQTGLAMRFFYKSDIDNGTLYAVTLKFNACMYMYMYRYMYIYMYTCTCMLFDMQMYMICIRIYARMSIFFHPDKIEQQCTYVHRRNVSRPCGRMCTIPIRYHLLSRFRCN